MTGDPPDMLSACRARLASLDDELLALLVRRHRLVRDLHRWKAEQDIQQRDPAQEQAVMIRLRAEAAGLGLDPDRVEEVFQRIVGVDLGAPAPAPAPAPASAPISPR